MRLGVILREYHFLPIDQRRLFLEERCLYSLKLLTIQVSSDGLTPFQKLIMDTSSCCPANTQQGFFLGARKPWACMVPNL
ncbi:unnamed protein product [Acanthoscelides obtectus]|uniref:Uncharacterized protein n=1 Tax=Acanthoscelides obtectus TaxID=200917 RepID=A0A9P0L437_ACAOB|nr:unnamed protein product [Acanthoscelides obtectus]CAK1677725.1 hypothetical protein AOBTE_LOCUS31514 [Acanthoscelides obtectus]